MAEREEFCLGCGANLVQPDGPGRPKKFCNATCRKNYWRRMRRLEVTEMRSCRACGQPFAPHEGKRGRPWTLCRSCRPQKVRKLFYSHEISSLTTE
jgi:hypothetical protein